MVRDVHKVSVADRGLRCNFYAVPGTTNAPAVILIDGAGGGFPADERIATELAASGYPTLAVAYFSNRLGEPSGLPSSLCEIPLEYFFSAIDWMKERPEVCRDKIVAMGQSRGSEAALLVASHRADIAGVLAFSPSNMVWQSQSYGTEIKSAWTLRGIPVDYVSYGYVPGGNMVSSTTIVSGGEEARKHGDERRF